MSRSIDGPECIHGHNLFMPTPCPECVGEARANRAALWAHPAFGRILKRADELMAQRGHTHAEQVAFAESNPGPPPKSWGALTGSGNPEVGDYAAGLEVAAAKHPEIDELHNLTRAYVQATVRGLRYAGLRKLVLRALDMLATIPNPARRKRLADNALGKWMSAALDDPNVCAEMKSDINEWFEAIENAKLAQKVLQQVRTAQVVMRAEREKWKIENFSNHYGIDPEVFKQNLYKPEPVAVHCTACGLDEPCAKDCANCEVPHCPIRPLAKSKPKHAARHARKAIKHHPKRKTHARSK